jgi:prepilin-type N-terminal cleavage/methylation domain-containing protein
MKIRSKKPMSDTKYKIRNINAGFTLIELLVAMLILMIVLGGMTAVSVAGLRSYQKSRATKQVFEDVGYAMNSIAKDVRMGKIESTDSSCLSSGINDKKNCLLVTRNVTREKVCYRIGSDSDGGYLAVGAAAGDSCPASVSAYKKMVNLSGTGMQFASTSGFYAMATDTESATKIRGWAQINLNIENPSMETDAIWAQTIVSSRDYGWKEAP